MYVYVYVCVRVSIVGSSKVIDNVYIWIYELVK